VDARHKSQQQPTQCIEILDTTIRGGTLMGSTRFCAQHNHTKIFPAIATFDEGPGVVSDALFEGRLFVLCVSR
jgi:hypothetical protein